MARRKRNDKFVTGFSAGLLLPMLVFIVVYYLKYSEVELVEFVSGLWKMKVLVKIMSLCAFPNLVLFLLYYRRKMDYAARGVIAATFIYAFIVLASRIM